MTFSLTIETKNAPIGPKIESILRGTYHQGIVLPQLLNVTLFRKKEKLQKFMTSRNKS